MNHQHAWGLQASKPFTRYYNRDDQTKSSGIDRTYRCLTCGETKLETEWVKENKLRKKGWVR